MASFGCQPLDRWCSMQGHARSGSGEAMSRIDRVEIHELRLRGAEPRPAAPRRRRRRQCGARQGRQVAGEPLRDPDQDRRRPGRRIRHPLGRHARLARPDDHAGAAPDRPRPRDARADLRRPEARAARLRPHGSRAARHRPLGPRRQEVRRLGRSRCSAAFASACRPMPARTMARRAAAASPARRRSPTSPSTARQLGYRGFKIHGWHDGDAQA